MTNNFLNALLGLMSPIVPLWPYTTRVKLTLKKRCLKNMAQQIENSHGVHLVLTKNDIMLTRQIRHGINNVT